MFLDELTPIFKELTQHQSPSWAGFSPSASTQLADEASKSWLDQQIGSTTYTSSTTQDHNGKTSGPRSISID